MLPAFSLLIPFFAVGCANVPVRYDPKTPPAARLVEAGLPKLLLEDVGDQSGMGEMHGPIPAAVSVAWTQVLQDALTTELTRLGWPMTQSKNFAQARLKATLVKTEAEWNAGFGVRVTGKMRISLLLKDPSGREVWEGELRGTGLGTAGGGGVPDNGIRESWNAALAEALSRLGTLLESERPWLQIGKVPAAVPVALAPVAARAPAVPTSDVDVLPAVAALRPRSFAVVIGIERYREKLPNADFAAGDAKLTAEYLKRVLGMPGENIALLTDDHAAKGDFEKYLERWLPNRVHAGDEVFIYYSGHGAPNPAKGDAYMVPYDGDPTYIEQTGYSVKRLYDQLAKLPAKQVYVAMDSCFSGAGGRSVIAQGARPLVSLVQNELPANITVLAASAGDQISNSYQEKGHGLFTYFLLKGLREKGPDMRAVYDYLKPEVSRVAREQYNADQDPQWRQGR
ncbi:MAG: hypothetical protein A2V88_01830 [Elusimicrobia bacterium RBG_16_66_12]|nr:MAG: hypothetical protein A2V88_01830 [Elusimicrobia bacterium RBG_16_66_12]